MKKIVGSIFSCLIILFVFAGCGHADEDRSLYQADLGRIRNNAKLSLAGDEEGFAAKVRRDDERIKDTKKSSYYSGPRRSSYRLSCVNWVGQFNDYCQ